MSTVPATPAPDVALAVTCLPDLAELAALLPAAPDGDDVLVDPLRLAGLLALGLHEPEHAGPRLAGLLARLAADLDVPVAIVTGLLPDVLVLAGAHGLEGWLAEARATPAEWAPCVQVVRTGRERVVPDLAQDPTLCDGPLATVDGVRAYAGVPLPTGGAPVGTLCVLDVAPREFSEADVARLREAAAEALLLLAVPPQAGAQD